uniref:Uncharacterized protein n=1 Tax=Pyxicephalus adspersus TaxID=30357 RepID=A0AAV3AKA2_PYXAD|nr:TPA: hypothetical protein GDO54_014344 [Pyxicephalus adspersus]
MPLLQKGKIFYFLNSGFGNLDFFWVLLEKQFYNTDLCAAQISLTNTNDLFFLLSVTVTFYPLASRSVSQFRKCKLEKKHTRHH